MEVDFAQESEKITANYTRDSGNLIPILQEAQEKFGYLPAEAMQEIAKHLRLPESTVFGVSTFYAQFKLTPTGRKTITVCRGTACHVRGGARILKEIERRLGIKPGETTEDMEYSLETVACIGACALAPTMRVDNETYGQMTTKKVVEVLGG
ncbi:MAG: NADH-quinone oxidoreductase subunit NuoE [Dehalococcoidia bacterium]